MPDACGSTSISTICAAIAASTAVPPAFSISWPACAASGCAAAIMSRCAVQPGLSTQLESSAGEAGDSAADVAEASAVADAGAAEAAAFRAPEPGAFAQPAVTARRAAASAPAHGLVERGRIRSVMNTSVRRKDGVRRQQQIRTPVRRRAGGVLSPRRKRLVIRQQTLGGGRRKRAARHAPRPAFLASSSMKSMNVEAARV